MPELFQKKKPPHECISWACRILFYPSSKSLQKRWESQKKKAKYSKFHIYQHRSKICLKQHRDAGSDSKQALMMEFWDGKDLKDEQIATPCLEQVRCVLTWTLLTHNSHWSKQLQRKINGKKIKKTPQRHGHNAENVPQQNPCTDPTKPFLATFKKCNRQIFVSPSVFSPRNVAKVRKNSDFFFFFPLQRSDN